VRRPWLVLLVALAAFGAASGCSSSSGSRAAKVGSVVISRQSLEDDLKAIGGADAYRAALEQSYGMQLAGTGKGTFNAEFSAQVLTLRVYYELIEQALVSGKTQITDANLADAEASVKDQFGGVNGGQAILDGFPQAYRDRLIRQQAVIAASRTMVSGATAGAEAYFNANPMEFAQTCVSHILVSTSSRDDATAKARALALKARLDKGEAFATVATESDDSAQGGDLGCHVPGDFVAEFETGMASATVGKVTDPVKSSYGYHLILVRERKTPTFVDVREEVQAKIDKKSSDQLDLFIQGLTCDGKVKVTIDGRYGKWDTSDCGGTINGLGRVKAPAAPSSTTTRAPTSSTTVAPTTTTTVK
jgi:parvulin-like peptidyl-prolyl isomerase